MAGRSAALIFAGGTGERLEGQVRPKQFVELKGKPVVAYTLERFQRHPEIDGIVLVAPDGWIDYCAKMKAVWRFDKIAAIVPGGVTSQESIRLGLEAASARFDGGDVVLIHDGVRPLIDAPTISRCIQCVRQYGSAITISPQTETVMIERGAGGHYGIVDRARCYMARAPQGFLLRDILDAHRRALEERALDFVDSASLMERFGCELHAVRGPDNNIKITTALDLRILRAILEEGEPVP